MVEGQDQDHGRGSWAGERSRLGVKVGDKVGVKVEGGSRSGGQGRGHGRGSRCWSPGGSRFSGGVEMKRKCS